MINKMYIDNMPEPKTNILHDNSSHNLSSLSSSYCSENQFNNLILNSNLDDANLIK